MNQGVNAVIKLKLYKFIASGCGSGYAPIMPGTVGTMAIFIPVILLFNPQYYLLLSLIFFLLGVLLCKKLATEADSDPQWIVIDEWAGLLLAMGLTYHASLPDISFDFSMVAILVLFRLFDITKPCYIKQLECKLTPQWGIMVDDMLAGLYAFITLMLLMILHRTMLL